VAAALRSFLLAPALVLLPGLLWLHLRGVRGLRARFALGLGRGGVSGRFSRLRTCNHSV
jgi:hypothetical protein